MTNEKRIGKYCTFVKRYVPIQFIYSPDGSSSKICEDSACGNAKCCLCDSFAGNKGNGKDSLGLPNQESE